MGEIILHGDCLINRAAELHQLFLHHLNGADPLLTIDMSATGRCDVSFFQLVCAACRSYAKKNKQIRLRNDLAPAVTLQFRKTGLAQACSSCDCAACLFKTVLRRTDQHGGKDARQNQEETAER